MSEESPKKVNLKLHAINLAFTVVCGVALAVVFLVGSHVGVVWTEVERVGLIGGIVASFGGSIYSAKKLPGVGQ